MSNKRKGDKQEQREERNYLIVGYVLAFLFAIYLGEYGEAFALGIFFGGILYGASMEYQHKYNCSSYFDEPQNSPCTPDENDV
jgi:hypothetical protein